MKAFEFQAQLQAGVPTKLGLFSDVHFDSPDCDKKALTQHLDYCLDDGRYILFNGDWFDAILLRDGKRAVNHLMESGDNQLNVKLEESAHFLDKYKDNILFMGRGNHEESILKYSGVDMLQLLVMMLNGGKGGVLAGNYANFLRFSWVKGRGKPSPVLRYDIYAHHGAGGSAPVTKGMIDFNRMAKGTNADLIWMGHKHNATADFSDPVMFVDNNGSVVIKNRQCIQTPSYQKGRTIDYNVNFAERFYTHQALSGFGEVNLTPYYEDGKPKLATEIKITSRPMAVLGQIQASRLRERAR